MRFGVFDHVDSNGMQVRDQYEQRLRLVELYDELGFYCFHLPEHHATELGRASSPSVFLAAVAQRTSRIRLGALVYLLPLHHPVRLLEEIAMLDQMSNGRFQVGVGRGGQPAEHSRFGLAEEDLVPMFEEALEILLKGMGQSSVSHQGTYYNLPEVPLRIPLVQNPHPPLWYGTASAHRNEWAADHAVNLLTLSPNAKAREIFEDYAERLDRRGISQADRPFMGQARQLVVAPTDAEAERLAERAWARFATSFNWLVNHLGRPAFPLPPTYSAAAAAGMAFAGSPEAVRQWVACCRDEAGISYLALELAFGDLAENEVAASARLFAQQVMPGFSG